MQSLISAKLLCECRQRGLESNLTSGMLGLLFVLQALGYSLEATPTILAVCSLCDQETNTGLLNFGDCNRLYSADVFLYRNRVFFEHKLH